MREIFCGDFVYFSSHVVEETKIDAGHLQLLQKQTASLGSSLRSNAATKCFALQLIPDLTVSKSVMTPGQHSTAW